MSEEQSTPQVSNAKQRLEKTTELGRRASASAAVHARAGSQKAREWFQAARQGLASQTRAGVEFGRGKRAELKCQREVARRERKIGQLVAKVHEEQEGPIALDNPLADELKALEEARASLATEQERSATARSKLGR